MTALLLLAGTGLYALLATRSHEVEYTQQIDPRPYVDRVGTFYGPGPDDKHEIGVAIRELQLPLFAGANAIWGASGRDDQGHIWIGVSVRDELAAHLIEYIPEHDRFVDHGDPLTALKAKGLAEEGTTQTKIHSKIIQADDGYLYFSSMDEEGENWKSGSLPHWGSNLWRYAPREARWEHLFHAPEGLIAISGVKRWVYALGYWDHILYQYDTHTGNVKRIRVGSEGGHVSRNIIADINGHIYVPRVKYHNTPAAADPSGDDTAPLPVTTLVEYDPKLNMINSFPLVYYAKGRRLLNVHGITGISYLADHSIVFVTGLGYLYQIIPSTDGGPARVEELGWIHPQGQSYTAALFPLDGKEWLLGVGTPQTRRKRGASQYDGMLYKLSQRTSRTLSAELPIYRHLLLYGSNTRDNFGNSYLVGRYDWNTPIIWQIYLE